MNKEKGEQFLSKKRRFQFTLITILLGLILIIAFGEIIIRLFNPQPYLYPRWKFSDGYGAMLYPNVTMINKRPGDWQFKYKINSLQYRGKPIPISDFYPKDNIVVLGDSYGFGTGVNDGEEFSSIIGEELKHSYDVVNLSVGGWGLTQQIRRYYEFGKLYTPKVVILQYCDNDLKDNFSNKVTIIENDKLKFVNSELSINWVKKYLSKSFIQKSQIYNLFRNNLYKMAESKALMTQLKVPENQNLKVSTEERFYGDLLTIFAKELYNEGTSLVMISVNEHLERSNHLKGVVDQLDEQGYLKYVNVKPWFEGVKNYGTPEGHIWGKTGHEILGKNLSKVIAEIRLNNH